jgi:hypothetical protein
MEWVQDSGTRANQGGKHYASIQPKETVTLVAGDKIATVLPSVEASSVVLVRGVVDVGSVDVGSVGRPQGP